MEKSPSSSNLNPVNYNKEIFKTPSQAEESLKNMPGGELLAKGVHNKVTPMLGKSRSMTARPLSFAQAKVAGESDRVARIKTLHPTLSDLYQPQIRHRVTNERLVAAKVASSKEGEPLEGDPYVTLWRGCTEKQFLAIVRAGSGGGGYDKCRCRKAL